MRKVDYQNCKLLLQIDFSNIDDLNKLQEYKTELIDAYRYINDFSELGLTKESIERGFILHVPDLSFNSFAPKDIYMSDNIKNAIKTISERMEEVCRLTEIKNNSPELVSGSYKDIYYSVNDDCCENLGGYYVELFKVLNGEVDFENRLDFMVIHIEDEYEMKNSKSVVEKYIEKLIKELENEEEEEI